MSWLSVLVAVAATASANERRSSLDDLGWMVGTWEGSAGSVQMEEIWTDARGGLMLGLHRDLRPSGSAFFEYLRIEVDGEGNVDYVASPRGGPSTPFRMTEIEAGRAVFENPGHDFPQRIIYWTEDDRTLCSRIEGTENGERKVSRWCWQRR